MFTQLQLTWVEIQLNRLCYWTVSYYKWYVWWFTTISNIENRCIYLVLHNTTRYHQDRISYLKISCSRSSSCFCLIITPSMMALSSGVRWDRSGPVFSMPSPFRHHPSHKKLPLGERPNEAPRHYCTPSTVKQLFPHGANRKNRDDGGGVAHDFAKIVFRWSLSGFGAEYRGWYYPFIRFS